MLSNLRSVKTIRPFMGSPDLSSSESLEYRNVLKTKLETVYYFNALFAEITRLGEFETSSEPHI